MASEAILFEYLIKGDILQTSKPYILALITTVICIHAYASPTSNEFEKCRKLAVTLLDYCIQENLTRPDATCWQKSQTEFKTCSKKVQLDHNRLQQDQKRPQQKSVKAQKEIKTNK